jgi:hypothetical protein
LLTVHYRPRTDALGRLTAWRPLTLDLRVLSVAADTITVERATLRFWVSADQGDHWRRATVLPRRDGTFTAVVPGLVPRPGQAVSVRAEATAAEGRAITQTIIDAYPVR